MNNEQLILHAIRSNDPDIIHDAYLLFADEAANNFKLFVKFFWQQVAASPLVDSWYLDAICDHLQHITKLKRLIINVPPRHGKSLLTTVLFPAWHWLQRPQSKFLCSSYSLKDLSVRDSIACRGVIESPLYQLLWADRFKLATDQNTKNHFNNDKLGYRIATSIESGNTGMGCDILIADDLNSVTKAHSEADRQSVIMWWTQVMSSRMNPGGLDCKIVIQQRCHEEDITGFILKQDDAKNWTHLILPWEFDPDRKCKTKLWQDPRTEKGEALSPLLDHDKVDELKGGNGLGATGFNCQYNQAPAAAEGNIFKQYYFDKYQETQDHYIVDEKEVLKTDCRTFITTDLAISLKSTADWTVADVWRITPHNHLLLVEEWRQRVEGPDAIKSFKLLCRKWKPDHLYVECVAFQKLMIQMLRQENLPVRELHPQGLDKRARAQKALAKAESGQVHLPEAEWVKEWLDEVCVFPNGRHDDRVDCLSWAGIVSTKYPVLHLRETVRSGEVQRKQESFLWD